MDGMAIINYFSELNRTVPSWIRHGVKERSGQINFFMGCILARNDSTKVACNRVDRMESIFHC